MKPVVYLLPGLMCDETVWLHQRAVLQAEFEVKIPVFRGFTSLREMALWVLETAPERMQAGGTPTPGSVPSRGRGGAVPAP